MGPDDSIEAVKLLKPKRVAPSHLQHLAADRARRRRPGPSAFRAETSAEPCLLEPGGVITL